MSDRPLPSNLEGERAVLGAILLDNAALGRGAEKLNAGDFLLPQHRHIFVSMVRLASGRQPLDTITLMTDLQSHSELEIVSEKAELRRLGYEGEAIREAALNGDRETALAHVAAAQSGVLVSRGLRAVAIEQLLACEIRLREMLLDLVLPEQGLAMLILIAVSAKRILRSASRPPLPVARDSCAGRHRAHGEYCMWTANCLLRRCRSGSR